jgi:hypothetical protein
MTEPSTAAEISRITRILASGASSISVEGVTTAINQVELRRRLRELQAKDPDTDVQRSVIQRVFLGGW